MGRAGRSGDLDTTVLYLASDASTYTTGQIIIVDDGWTAFQAKYFKRCFSSFMFHFKVS